MDRNRRHFIGGLQDENAVTLTHTDVHECSKQGFLLECECLRICGGAVARLSAGLFDQ